jgi:uncharacterized protein (TIGR02231 family)
MKYLVAVLVLIVCLPVLAQEEKAVKVNSRIETVTVYRAGATVVRKARLKVDAGLTVAFFENLPARLDVNSVRGRVEGDRAVQIIGVESKKVRHEAPVAESMKELDKKISDLKDQKAELEAQKAAYQAEVGFAKTVAAGTLGKEAGVDPEKLTETARFVRETIMRAEREKLSLARRIREVEAKMSVFQENARQLRIEGSRSTHTVSMTLSAPRAARIVLVVTYRVIDAAWVAAHDVRLNERTGEVELTAYAVVNQQSGEEWRDVRLTFSTAHPTASVALPEFRPLVMRPQALGRSQRHVILLDEEMQITRSMPRGTSFDNLSNKNLAAKGFYLDPQKKHQRQMARFANVSQKSAAVGAARNPMAIRFSNVTFHRDKSETIPMDDRPHRCVLFTARFKGKVERISIPALAEAVFLRAKVTNTCEHPVLPGIVNVFIDADFIGTAFMDPVAPGEKFEVYFGADKNLKVTRKLLESRSEGPTKFRSSHKVMRHWKTSLQNFHRKAVEVIVVDQVPVSWSDDVRVEVSVLKPKPGDKQPDRFGRVEWKVKLDSLKKMEFELAYEAEFPAGTAVNIERKSMKALEEYYEQKKK